MDVSFNNVLEGTRQYFMGVPKQAQADGSGQPWPPTAPLPEEGAPAQSGAPAPSSRPPSAAAAPPSVPSSTPIAAPPRPPSEPIEPEPHIIHKATVMREAAEKRREQPEIEDDEEAVGTLSPPSHIIRKPPRTLPSPAPAPAAPCPSPARPPSAAPLQPPVAPESQLEPPAQYRQPVHRAQTPTARQPDHYAPGRPPDPYPTSRPPEPYGRYHYDANMSEGRNSHGPVASPQPSTHSRQSPQTYARLSGSMPQHTASRLRDVAAQSPPTQRYQMPPAQPPPPPNDRVPPIHHPQPAPPAQRHSADSRSAQMQYASLQQRRDPSPYGRTSSHYDRHPVVPPRKYDPQQAYPSYRPAPVAQPVQSHRVDTHHQVQYKHAPMDVMTAHYSPRPQDRSPVPIPPHPHDAARLPPRAEYPNMSRPVDTRSGYHYPTPSTSTSRYGPSAPVPIGQNSTQSRSVYARPATAPKTSYEYAPAAPVQTSPARSTVKPGYPNQARMTVSVTTLVNQMNQTKQKQEPPVTVTQVCQSKQKRESPLDLSVKTVKNSADSSTTQDDAVDSAAENKMISLPHRPSSSSSRHAHLPTTSYASHKVDFAPNFTQYGERVAAHVYPAPSQPAHTSMRYNGTYETRPVRTLAEAYPVESPHPYQERNIPLRAEYVPKIDLTRSLGEQRHPDNRVRDDRHFIIEERKRPAGPIASNIPEKIVRYETWTADSRIDHLNQSAREQRELMKQPVYSYSRYKQQLETYQNEQKRPPIPGLYREHHSQVNRRYSNNPYQPDLARETSDYHAHYHDRNPSANSRHLVIQKPPSHRDIHPHHFDPSSGIPADKRVLSILRNSLETKQTGFVEPPRQAKQVPDLIVIDDAEDSVIDITDLTKENEAEIASKHFTKLTSSHITPNLHQHIQMPKAVDSLPRDSDYHNSPDPKPISPENDVASRIRTKAELKVMPPSDTMAKVETKQITPPENEKLKLLPRKTHLFNQIREDNLRLESVIKNEEPPISIIAEVKTEPMNIEEIEKDAEISIKTENILESLEPIGLNEVNEAPVEDLDWANACDSFMEQLKAGCHKKKVNKRRIDTPENENESKVENSLSLVSESSSDKPVDEITTSASEIPPGTSIMAPSQQTSQSTAEITNPAEETTKPMAEATKPEAEIIKSAAETTKPSKESTKPAVETTKSEVEASKPSEVIIPPIVIKQEPLDEDDIRDETEMSVVLELPPVEKQSNKSEKHKTDKNNDKQKESDRPSKIRAKAKVKIEKPDNSSSSLSSRKELKEKTPIKTVIKEELESTDDDEPLIKSKILKDKEKSDRLKYQLLKDLSEKSAYVKLECCDVDVNKNTRKSLDSTISKDKEEKQGKGKLPRQMSRSKGKLTIDNNKNEKQDVNSSSDSDDDDLSVARRLRMRKNTKTEDNKTTPNSKTSVKSSPLKKQDSSSASNSSTPVQKPTFGDGSYFHPGWEEELYKYKRSLRMPTRLIAIPRGRSGGPFVRKSGAIFTRGSTSLPDLDPAPLSPAPSSAPSAATDDLYARRPDKLTLDSDLDSNSSYSTPHKLHYDSEASTSTVLSSTINKKKSSSIVDMLIQKCGKKEETKKEKKSKDKDDKTPKVISKKSTIELLPTPSLGLVKNGNKGSFSVKKEKLMEDIFYLGAFRKETVTAFRNSFIKDTDGLIGATEEFAPLVLKSRTRTESRVLKQRATIKEVFGDERPASAPPTSCREEELPEEKEVKVVEIKKEPESKPKFKPRKIVKDKLKRRSSSIRDGLRSTKSLKRNDAKGRLMRLKKRNSIMKSLNHKRTKELSANKHKNENSPPEDKDKPKVEGSSLVPAEGVTTKRRLKRLFGRRKFSSGFDYIRKKKKIIRREENATKIRRPAVKPSPESVHDIKKEIKGWFINKSIGETHLHRAARLGYTDCVAYCLEKLESDPSAKDNAGFTPLHVASARGHVRIARLLLQYGANVSAAAQGGIRPLHEACENSHVELIRLLLAYGADPLLGTYAGQTPEELTEGPATTLLRLHIADVQGKAIEPWRFPPPTELIDREEMGCDALSSPPPASPPPPPDSTIEIQCTEAPLPPFYSLRTPTGQPADGLWCLLQDITNLLQIKSKDSLLKQIHCGSGSPKELLREIRTQEFLERAQCHQLLGAGEKVNVRASKVALVRVTDKLRQLLKIETVLVS